MARSYRNIARPDRRIKTVPYTREDRSLSRITVPARAVNVSDYNGDNTDE